MPVIKIACNLIIFGAQIKASDGIYQYQFINCETSPASIYHCDLTGNAIHSSLNWNIRSFSLYIAVSQPHKINYSLNVTGKLPICKTTNAVVLKKPKV